MRINKFQTAQLKLGPLEGEMLYRVLIAGTAVLLSVFFLNMYGLLSLAVFPLFVMKLQSDYLDEIIVKKIRGIIVPDLVPLISNGKAIYEIFGANYGFSELQDDAILHAWASIVNIFSEDMLILRIPYKVPLERFLTGREEYDSLFANLEFTADAYFIVIESSKSEEFESTMASHGIAISRLTYEEERTIGRIF